MFWGHVQGGSLASAQPEQRSSVAPTATLSPSSASDTEIGDLVIVTTSSVDNAAVGPPAHVLQSGFTELQTTLDPGSSTLRLSIAYKIATVAGAQTYQAYTASGSSLDYTGLVVVKKNTFDARFPIWVSRSTSVTSGVAPTPPSISGGSTSPYGGRGYVFGAWHMSAAAVADITPPTGSTAQTGGMSLVWQVAGSVRAELACATDLVGTSSSALHVTTSFIPSAFGDDITPDATAAATVIVTPYSELPLPRPLPTGASPGAITSNVSAVGNPIVNSGSHSAIDDLIIVATFSFDGGSPPATHTLQSGFTEIFSETFGAGGGADDMRLSLGWKVATAAGVNAYECHAASAVGTTNSALWNVIKGTFDSQNPIVEYAVVDSVEDAATKSPDLSLASGYNNQLLYAFACTVNTAFTVYSANPEANHDAWKRSFMNNTSQSGFRSLVRPYPFPPSLATVPHVTYGLSDDRIFATFAVRAFVDYEPGDGASDGLASTSGIGASTAASAGASDGVATATATGESTAAAAGSSDGVATATATGESTAAAAGSSDGVATATATGESTAAAAGSSDGVATATAEGEEGSTVVDGVGASDGVATAVAVGESTAAAVGASAGIATATATGESTAASVGTSDGVATATATGESTAAAVGNADGTATATAVGIALIPADGAATGVAAATAIGESTAVSVGASTGEATVTAVGESTAASNGAAAGIATATATGESTAVAVAVADGLAIVSAVGESTADAVGNADGTSTAEAVAFQQGSDGLADGTSTATAVGESTAESTGVSDGVATASATGASVVEAVGVAAGAATADATGASTIDGVGLAAGAATNAATGASTADADGVSAGVSTATAIATALYDAAGNSTGLSTVIAIALAIHSAVGSCAGVSTCVGRATRRRGPNNVVTDTYTGNAVVTEHVDTAPTDDHTNTAIVE